jgi:hypothetical protein
MEKSTARPRPTPAPGPDDVPLGLTLTCAECSHTYEPTAEDWLWRRVSCPIQSCRGWTFSVELTVPDGGAR